MQIRMRSLFGDDRLPEVKQVLDEPLWVLNAWAVTTVCHLNLFACGPTLGAVSFQP